MPTKVQNDYGSIMALKRLESYDWDDKKGEAQKTISEADLKFLKEFGDTTISIAGIWAVSKMLKK